METSKKYQYWNYAHQPPKPQKQPLKDEGYLSVTMDVSVFGRYDDILLDDLVESKNEWLLHNSKDKYDIKFHLETECDDDELSIHFKVKYRILLNEQQIKTAKAFNERIEQDYQSALSLYKLRMIDWFQFKKDQEETFIEKERAEYMRLKAKFETK